MFKAFAMHFFVFFYILHIQLAVSEKALSNIFSLIQKQPWTVFLWKKVFLEVSQNSQENTCGIVSFLLKLQASACNFIKK